MNKNKQLIIISSYIKNIRYEMPKKAEELNKRTIKSISNAIGDGIVDSKGFIWFDCNRLHTILRVKTKNDAAYILEKIDNKYKVDYNSRTYVRWSSLLAIVGKRIEENPKNDYLKLVLSILNEINNSNDVRVLQDKAKELQEKNIKKLKKQRIKNLKILKDELTNEKLDEKRAEFSHIRSVTMYPEFSEFIWNGLIVNKETHNIITSEAVNDEEQLYSLCFKKGWNIQWYDKYKEMLNN
ncbi:hypothetical protein [Clostridium cuniculi]|uniref:hypothetical protein n=1 Tax=Clostridium cuniculi TaxID=2548455 RepID=UPI0010547026|nr:hypothetical protein [Clostridium cuniculi]